MGSACTYSCCYHSRLRQQYELQEKPCGDCCHAVSTGAASPAPSATNLQLWLPQLSMKSHHNNCQAPPLTTKKDWIWVTESPTNGCRNHCGLQVPHRRALALDHQKNDWIWVTEISTNSKATQSDPPHHGRHALLPPCRRRIQGAAVLPLDPPHHGCRLIDPAAAAISSTLLRPSSHPPRCAAAVASMVLSLVLPVMLKRCVREKKEMCVSVRYGREHEKTKIPFHLWYRIDPSCSTTRYRGCVSRLMGLDGRPRFGTAQGQGQ
uniref:Uncharacterized protein n=1 Tax=Oryza barthii TaxID=65489 RepID=A0A0D3FIZ7_9ORYZ